MMKRVLSLAGAVAVNSFVMQASAQDPPSATPQSTPQSAPQSSPSEPTVNPDASSSTSAPGLAGAPVGVEGVQEVHREGFSLGYTLHRFQDDFGMSAMFGSPTFANDSLRISIAGGIAWYPYAVTGGGPTTIGNQTWLPYYHARAVIEAGRRIDGTPLRVYGVGGFIAIFTPDRLSSDVFHPGGYGGFGFEFYMPKDKQDGPVSYLLELGGIGTGLGADKLPGKPIVANGFLINVGLRFYP